MNILHISTSDTGGAAKAALRLHIELLRKKINSKVLVLDQNSSNGKEVYPFFQSYSKLNKAIDFFKRHIVPAINSRKLKGKTATYEIFSFENSFIDVTKHPLYKEADIIHLHFISEFIDYKSFFKKNQKPAIWTLHDMNTYTGGCHYSAECIKFYDSCFECPQLRGTKNNNLSLKIQKTKIEALKKNNFMTIVSPSEWIFKTASKSKILKNKNHIKINHGIDLNLYKPRNKEYCRDLFNIPRDEKVVLFIAEDFSRDNKGFDVLLNSIKKCGKSIKLCTVGKLEKSISNEFNHVHLGYIYDDLLLSQVYSMADITVIPSIYESFSLTTQESLSCGTPVIAFNNSGPGELIKNNVTGFTTIVGDIQEMVAKIKELLFNESILKEFSHSARVDVEKRFDISNRANDYVDEYKKLINKTKL